jgi:hypothetical protein
MKYAQKQKIRNIFLRMVLVFFGILGGFGFFAANAQSPGTRLEQLIKSDMSVSSTGNGIFQKLYCGDLSGQIEQATVSLANPYPGNKSVQVFFFSQYSTSDRHRASDIVTVPEGTSQKDYTFHFTQPVDIEGDICSNPDGYIWMMIQTIETGGVFYYGSTDPNAYRNWNFYGGDNNIKDLYFIINGTAEVNHAPVLTVADQTGSEGRTVYISPSVYDQDGGPISVTASNLPRGAVFQGSTFLWTPAFDQSGTYTVTFTAVDDGNQGLFPAKTVVATSTITIAEATPQLNRLEQLIKSDMSVSSTGNGIFQKLYCGDLSGQIEQATVSLANPYPGNKSVQVFFFSQYSTSDRHRASDIVTVPEGTSQKDYTFHFTQPVDIEGDICSNPDGYIWMMIQTIETGGVFYYGSTDPNAYRNWNFYGGDNNIKDLYFIINGTAEVNHAPVFGSVGNQTTNEGQPFQFTVSATDPDNNAVTLSASNLPAGATFDLLSGSFAWTPSYDHAGNYTVHFVATDNGTPIASSTLDVPIVVNNVNRTPVISSVGNQTADEGQTFQFNVTATDPDNDTVTLSAENLPTGATFDTLTGGFAWTPGFDQAGDYTVHFIATDNGTPMASSTLDVPIVVNNVNRAPVLDPIGDKMTDENQTLQFVVMATDPDGDALTYSASNLPAGASFNPSTGAFSWMPSYGQAGNYTNVEFTATDNGSPMQLDTKLITITVNDINRPPVFIAIGSQEVPENQPLAFTVSATDPDGNSFVLSASNLPSGSAFNSSTGVFSWTPSFSQAGTYVADFTATDNGTPTASSVLQVVITVGDVPTPTEQAGNLIDVVVDYSFPTAVENSYLANLRKVPKFIEDGKITSAINQLDAFIQKVNQDLSSGLISQAEADQLIALANALKSDLGN